MLEQSWLIDGKPAKWSDAFNVSHISVVGRIEERQVSRKDPDRVITISVFMVVVGPKTITCAHEDMGPEATENFRKSLIIAWAAELEKQS